jgi:predicted DNA-binding transcriptional regulator AlpA
MSVQQSSEKAAATVTEVAAMCQLSRSRFYDLVHAGVFPKPVHNETVSRPIYVRELIDQCLEIRRTGIGLNQKVVVFNHKRRRSAQAKPRQVRQPVANEHGELVEALRSLGLAATGQDVQSALSDVYPTGTTGIDQGEVIRRLFLHLRGRK